ncbi:hypothetical protein LIER_38377 [Lithospermum erythrorhizon]|uniref:Endonuclease/exonuclease/phosphatase domain-containing protein n=1 Tax=Lithospermum erythrorhizon TaxID=34254 RepID=A0AAV3Q3C7_LITER
MDGRTAIGDFNALTGTHEQWFAAQLNVQAVDEFNEALEIFYLTDLGYIRGSFTHTNGRMFSRVVGNTAWLDLFSNSKVSYLARTHSDHSPILVELSSDYLMNKSSFKFQNMWTSHENFIKVDEAEVKNKERDFELMVSCRRKLPYLKLQLVIKS